jgi:hypothetical protein
MLPASSRHQTARARAPRFRVGKPALVGFAGIDNGRRCGYATTQVPHRPGIAPAAGPRTRAEDVFCGKPERVLEHQFLHGRHGAAGANLFWLGRAAPRNLEDYHVYLAAENDGTPIPSRAA